NLLFLSLPLVVISQQYSTQRANVDTVPAWYQGHPKQMNPGYGYERVQGASQANMNYHNYPTFGANRPAYPELTMGGVAPTRRYPVGGQDVSGSMTDTTYNALSPHSRYSQLTEKATSDLAFALSSTSLEEAGKDAERETPEDYSGNERSPSTIAEKYLLYHKAYSSIYSFTTLGSDRLP
ncbi:hypothetical protein NECAME_07356, partial [Necator americanus]